MIKAVLFDADGVLVDACELHYVALNRALAEFGFEITEKEHVQTYNGLPTRVKLRKLTEAKGLPVMLHEEIHSLKQRYTVEMIEELLKRDESKIRLLQELCQRGLLIGVCSNSLHATLERMLRAAGIVDCVHTLVGNDEVARPKPAPDIYLEGAMRLGVRSRECVIVEDSPVGLLSAHAAEPAKIVKVSGPAEVTLDLLPRLIGQQHKEEVAQAA